MTRITTTTLALLLCLGCGGSDGDGGAPATDTGVAADTGAMDTSAEDANAADTGVAEDTAATMDTADDDTGGADTGEPRPMRIGLALGGAVDPVTGMEEPFEAQIALADELGAGFVNLPLDWRVLEPGPSDDFSFQGLDVNRWETSALSPQVEGCGGSSNPCARWRLTEAELGWMRTRYVLEGDYEAQVRVMMPADAGVGSTATLLLDGTAAPTGNRCEAGDRFTAVVFSREASDYSASVAICDDGAFQVPTTTLWSGDASAGVTARIARRGDTVSFYLGDLGEALHTTAAVAEAVRPWLVASGRAETPGAVAVDFDDWSVGASPNRFDSPELRYSVDPGFFDIIEVVNLVYTDRPIAMSLRTINTNRPELPNDLQTLIDPATGKIAFDDPRIAARFEALTTHVLGRLSNEVGLVFLSVGNEIDIYLGDDPAAWRAWTAFAEAAIPMARDKLATLQGAAETPVSAKLTENALGLSAPVQAEIDATLAVSDAVMINVYPTDDGFRLVSDAELTGMFDEIAERFEPTGLPMMITEFGVHSVGSDAPLCALECATCNGSEALQADRYRAFFGALDAHPRIELIMLNWLTDVPCATLDAWAVQYGSDAPAFLGFLGSLGLRRRDGTKKPAFDVIREEIDARGW